MLASPDLDNICGNLRDLQRRRILTIRQEIACRQPLTSFVVQMLGFDPNADQDKRDAVWTRAMQFVDRHIADMQAQTRAELTGKKKPKRKDFPDQDKMILQAVGEEISTTAHALQPITLRRIEVESEMKRFALLTPGAPLTEDVAGFNALGLAVIIGESGNIANYANVAKLWRRLGYGMAKGHEAHAYSTWRKNGKLDKDGWIAAGYSPKRLGQIFGVVTVPLAMHKAKNVYGKVYEARKARTLQSHPEWYLSKEGKPKVNKEGVPTSAHAHMDALRVMTKALLRDLWAAWHSPASSITLKPSVAVSPEPLSPQAATSALKSKMRLPQGERSASPVMKPKPPLPSASIPATRVAMKPKRSSSPQRSAVEQLKSRTRVPSASIPENGGVTSVGLMTMTPVSAAKHSATQRLKSDVPVLSASIPATGDVVKPNLGLSPSARPSRRSESQEGPAERI